MKIKNGIYIIPNLFTTGNFFCGFYSIISVINENYYHAAWAILIGLVFDGLDGKIARLTKSSSSFGVEYDSLSDLISFGVAPALLLYVWVLKPFGRIGWLAAFLFVICGALRLARFNSQDADVRNDNFVGLPIPAAAALIASMVLMTREFLFIDKLHPMILAMTVYLLAFLMVSNIKYRSFKKLELTKKKSFSLLLFAILSIYIIATLPELIVFLIMLAYMLSGPVEWILHNVNEPKSRRSDRLIINDESGLMQENEKGDNL